MKLNVLHRKLVYIALCASTTVLVLLLSTNSYAQCDPRYSQWKEICKGVKYCDCRPDRGLRDFSSGTFYEKPDNGKCRAGCTLVGAGEEGDARAAYWALFPTPPPLCSTQPTRCRPGLIEPQFGRSKNCPKDNKYGNMRNGWKIRLMRPCANPPSASASESDEGHKPPSASASESDEGHK